MTKRRFLYYPRKFIKTSIYCESRRIAQTTNFMSRQMELKLCSDMAWVPKRRDGLIRLGAVHAIFESVFKYSASMTVVLVLVLATVP